MSSKLVPAFMAVSTAALVLVSAGCKPRNPDAAGLLSEPSASSGPEIQAGGNWLVSCVSRDDDDHAKFTLNVRGAVSPTDEGQDVLVTASKTVGDKSETLSDSELGHGAINPAGSVFIGFLSGVLTANGNSAKNGYSHAGVLTLAQDPNVEGLKVLCNFTKTSPH